MYLNEIKEILSKKDLTQDPNHCIGVIISKIKEALQKEYSIEPSLEYGNRVVSIDDNYYALGYDSSEITLSKKYTRYINEEQILRTQMSSTVPPLLRNYKKGKDTLYMCPGQVYRRDVRDKTHVGEPHQLDIWYVTQEKKSRDDLLKLVQIIINVIESAKKQKIKWRYTETSHHYTDDGIEVEIWYNNKWLEILECGLISKKLLQKNNLSNYSGLALGLGLDRLAMIIKDIEDIRVLLSNDVRVINQLSDLKKYKEVSKQPSIKRDLSIAVAHETTLEELTEIITKYNQSHVIEAIELLNETSYDKLPQVAIERLGLSLNQKNVLLRITLRDLTQSITNQTANIIYEDIYHLIHQGSNGYHINI